METGKQAPTAIALAALSLIEAPSRRRGVGSVSGSTRFSPLEAGGEARCFWCGLRHPAKHPLAVCPACVALSSTVRALRMNGPYPLSDGAIEGAVTRTSPGNYALGFMEDGAFRVFFVGRSDADVRQCLHDWVGMPAACREHGAQLKASWNVRRRGRFPVAGPAFGTVSSADSPYAQFAYSYAPSADAAYEEEWRNYDDFGGSYRLDNEAPPSLARISA
jgi:hypothetical protein